MKKPEQTPHSDTVFFAKILVEELSTSASSNLSIPERTDIRFDVNLMYKLYDLQKIVRFLGQTHWEEETKSFGHDTGKLTLENVAAHSYQVARSVPPLASHFPWVNTARAIELALVHDEPEIVIGDKDPVGVDGQGNTTHAFDDGKRQEKDDEERGAIDVLASGVRPSIRGQYRQLLAELIEGSTVEAQFVKAVDKLQSLVFVRLKKSGKITPDHAAFTIRYSRIGVRHFPQLQGHFMCVLQDLIDDVASVKPGKIRDFCAATWSRLKDAEKP